MNTTTFPTAAKLQHIRKIVEVYAALAMCMQGLIWTLQEGGHVTS